MLRNSKYMPVTSPQTPALVDYVRRKEEPNENTHLKKKELNIKEFITGTLNISVCHYLTIAPLLLPKEKYQTCFVVVDDQA